MPLVLVIVLVAIAWLVVAALAVSLCAIAQRSDREQASVARRAHAERRPVADRAPIMVGAPCTARRVPAGGRELLSRRVGGQRQHAETA